MRRGGVVYLCPVMLKDWLWRLCRNEVPTTSRFRGEEGRISSGCWASRTSETVDERHAAVAVQTASHHSHSHGMIPIIHSRPLQQTLKHTFPAMSPPHGPLSSSVQTRSTRHSPLLAPRRPCRGKHIPLSHPVLHRDHPLDTFFSSPTRSSRHCSHLQGISLLSSQQVCHVCLEVGSEKRRRPPGAPFRHE